MVVVGVGSSVLVLYLLLCLLTSDLLSSFFELRFSNFLYGASMPVADSLNRSHPGCTFTLFFQFGSVLFIGVVRSVMLSL